MGKKRIERRRIEVRTVILGLLVMVSLVISPAFAFHADAANGRSTKEVTANTETKQNEKVVRVGWYDSPFNYKDDNGHRTGYAYDYEQRIAAYTGWKYEYVEGSWPELLEMLKNGEIDLLSDVSQSEEREGQMLFSDAVMGTEEYNIIVAGNNTEIRADDLKTLNGKKIGINRGSIQEEMFYRWMAENGIQAEVIASDVSENEYMELLRSGEMDAVVNVAAFNTHMSDSIPIAVICSSDFYFAVNTERGDLLKDLDNAMTQIHNQDRYYNSELDQKYMSSAGAARYLSNDEVNWLKEHKAIRVGYLTRSLPYSERKSGNGSVGGMLNEFMTDSSNAMKNASIDFEAIPFDSMKDALTSLESGKIDCVFPCAFDAYSSEKRGLITTQSFGNAAVSAVVRKADRSDFDMNSSHGVLAVIKGDENAVALQEAYFPNWKLASYDSLEGCLQAVNAEKADCTLLSSYQENLVAPQLERYRLTTIATGQELNSCFAVRADELQVYSILCKLIHTYTQADINSMMASNSYRSGKISLIEVVRSNMLVVVTTLALLLILISLLLAKSIRSGHREKLAAEEAEAANYAKTSFLFSMSHDIRTPMNAIIGFRNLLEQHQENPELRQHYLEKMEESSEILLSILNNVLEMARIEKGTLVIEETPCSAYDFNEALTSIFDGMVKERELNFTKEINVQHPYVYSDMTKLREIFMNILSNACKYTPAGGSISMALDELPSDREGYVVYRSTISDTGIGMSEEFLPKLFEEFSRERSVTDNKIEGTGLGMPIVKRLVELLGGTIEVESEVGVGTTFIVTLTHRIADEADLAPKAKVSVDEKEFVGKRILLAEDNAVNREIAVAILSDAGFEIDCAEDGRQCVEMHEKSDHDLILMDIQMPNMNGYEATQAIRMMSDPVKAAIPIVAMTANAFEEDKRNAIRAGMNGHVAKPIDIQKLMDEIAKVIG